MGSIDASGRVSDRTVIAALQWRPGDRLTITATTQRITAHRDPVGMVTLTAKPYIVIPATLRHRCGISTGDRVLLAATPDDDTLHVYPMAAVHDAIACLDHTVAEGGVAQ
jgi:AbrB family looped-hinge helix DNA binding protein